MRGEDGGKHLVLMATECLQRDSDLMDWDLGSDEEDANKKTSRKNVFDIDDGDVETFGLGSGFAPSRSDIKTFMKQSRGISLNDYDDDDVVGEPWGGIEYSINKPRTESSSSVQSARTRSTPPVNQQPGSFGAVPVQKNSPSRPPPPASVSASKAHPERSTFPSSSTSSSVTPTSSSSSSSRSDSSSTSHSTSSSTKPANAIRSHAPHQDTGAALKTVASSISDVISSSPQISASEYHKLQAEIKQLKRELQQSRRQKKEIPSTQETVKNIMQGEPYSLEVYKSLKEKLELLDCALKMHDGNVIIVIVLFLKRTLRKGLFNTTLQTRPKAVNQLCKYMKDHYDFEELAELYRKLGRHEEAAILKFKYTAKSKVPDVRLRQLENVLRADFAPFPELADSTATVTEYINLLKIQIPIDTVSTKTTTRPLLPYICIKNDLHDIDTDAEAGQKRSNQMLMSHPRKAPIVFYSVITTLYYCTFYHHGESEGTISSPQYINRTFKLTDKQYEWTVLASLGKARKWKLIEEQLTGKGWFGSTRSKSIIGFDSVVELLAKGGAPVDILSKYLRLVDDQHTRIALATRLKCHDVVIETCVAMKDRVQLQQYRDKIERFAPQQALITDYLRNSQMKWKN